jgi:ankyrin repeat protein
VVGRFPAFLLGLWLVLAGRVCADPIHDAASQGSSAEVEKILTADPQAWRRLDSSGMTALLLAIKENHPEIVKLLLDRGADPNQKTPQNWSPLHEAAVTGNPEIVSALLAKGANPRVFESQNHGTPLHIACFQGNQAICELLVKAGADLTARDREHLTPLFHAKDQGHGELVKWLRAHGAK